MMAAAPERLGFRSVLLTLMFCAVVSPLAAAKSGPRITSLEEMLALLAKARKVEITGVPPIEPRAGSPVVRYPKRFENSAEIRQLLEFFRRADLHANEGATKRFRDGAASATTEATTVTIDGLFSFGLLGTNHVVFADSLTDDGAETPGPIWSYFHRDFALMVARIDKGRARLESKRGAK